VRCGSPEFPVIARHGRSGVMRDRSWFPRDVEVVSRYGLQGRGVAQTKRHPGGYFTVAGVRD
jgi:hypothetical protein